MGNLPDALLDHWKPSYELFQTYLRAIQEASTSYDRFVVSQG